jgi:hypothetical protein
MDISHIHETERKFLLQSVRWCQEIDPYINVLGLRPMEVRAFEVDLQAVLFITRHYKSFANSFILYHINTMRRRLALLVNQCMQSPNYTRHIGYILGIEKRAEFRGFTIPQLDRYKSLKN